LTQVQLDVLPLHLLSGAEVLQVSFMFSLVVSRVLFLFQEVADLLCASEPDLPHLHCLLFVHALLLGELQGRLVFHTAVPVPLNDALQKAQILHFGMGQALSVETSMVTLQKLVGVLGSLSRQGLRDWSVPVALLGLGSRVPAAGLVVGGAGPFEAVWEVFMLVLDEHLAFDIHIASVPAQISHAVRVARIQVARVYMEPIALTESSSQVVVGLDVVVVVEVLVREGGCGVAEGLEGVARDHYLPHILPYFIYVVNQDIIHLVFGGNFLVDSELPGPVVVLEGQVRGKRCHK